MDSNEKFVVVRELYPEIQKRFFGMIKKCPAVDDSRESVFGMDSSGSVVDLPNEQKRDDAMKKGDRVFAVRKKAVDFSTVFLKVCKEDGYEWNYAMEGEIRVSDYPKFLSNWACDEGACGGDGVDSSRFAHRVMALLEPIVRDKIRECRKEHNNRIRDIEEKDVLPLSFWSKVFVDAVPQVSGLAIEVTGKSFLSPDRDMEEKILAEEEARIEREEQAERAHKAVIDKKQEEAELAEIDRQKKRDELDFEVEKAEKEAKIRKCQIEAEAYQFQMANLKNDQKEIAAALEKANGNMTKMETLSAAMSEAVAKIQAIADKLSKLGIMTDGASAVCPNIDPAVAPRYQGMSDNFLNVVTQIKSKAKNAVTLTYQARDSRCGFGTRTIISDAYTTRTLGRIGSDCNCRQRSVLRIGDGITIRMTSERSGYLTLINFGTTPGVVNKIFPDRTYGAKMRRIDAGRHYVMPGDLIPCPDGCEYWPVGGATTAQYGLKERVLAIVTDREIDIDATCFASKVGEAMAGGEFEAIESAVASYLAMMDIEDGTWSWGLLEAVVEG